MLQLGQHRFSFQQILRHLMTSPSLFQYLRLTVIDETLAQWQQSPDYDKIQNEVAAAAFDRQVDRLTGAAADPAQVEADTRALMLQKYKQSRWGHQISSYFLVRKRQLDRVIFSAIQVDNLGIAQELYLRVKERHQSFDKLAQLYSQGEAAKVGGVMGPLAIERVHPQIAAYLVTLAPRDLSPLFQIDNAHVFIRLEQRLPAKLDDEMKQRLLDELYEQWLRAEIADRMSSLDVQLSEATATKVNQLPQRQTSPTLATSEQRQLELGSEIDIDAIPVVNSDRFSEESLASVASGFSFFPPRSNLPLLAEGVSHRSLVAAPERSSIFVQQSTGVQRMRGLRQQFVAFWLFFSLFLGGGFGGTYLFKYLAANQMIPTESR